MADAVVRSIGFRHGTDDELAAMHLVESEVAGERWPERAPQPLERYVAFARSLPSHYDDHAWLAESGDGTPLGCAACWSNAAGDARVMECYVYVRPTGRRQGVSWQLARGVVESARTEGRPRLVWVTYDTLPAGEEFSRRIGGEIARINRNSDLPLAGVDWGLLRSWIEDGARRAIGYQLQFWDGPYEEGLLEDAAQFHHIMNTAPRDELDIGDVVLGPEHMAEHDRQLAEAGRRRWTVFARSPDGACVGGTEVIFEDWEPSVAFQQNTAIHPAHRGRGLAKWAKALMLEKIRADRPGIEVISTGNAFSNGPMLAINDAMGFEVTEVRTEWQGDPARLWRALPA